MMFEVLLSKRLLSIYQSQVLRRPQRPDGEEGIGGRAERKGEFLPPLSRSETYQPAKKNQGKKLPVWSMLFGIMRQRSNPAVHQQRAGWVLTGTSTSRGLAGY